MKKLITVVFWVATYFFCVIFGVIVHFLRKVKAIKVSHWRRFPHFREKMILVSNHPSLLEPFLLSFLFLKQFLFYPLKLGPWSTPDKNNFLERGWWYWLAPKMIPIPRGDRKGGVKALLKIKSVLESGGIVIIFPEGGRTFKGRSFLFSKTGKKIRELKTGVGWLVQKTNAAVLPVWIEGTDYLLADWHFANIKKWGRITIKIGKILEVKDSPQKSKEEITQEIANALLNLADE